MKKRLALFLAFLMMVSLAGCSSRSSASGTSPAAVSSTEGNPSVRSSASQGAGDAASSDGKEAGSAVSSDADTQDQAGRILVAYFSVPETDKTDSMNAEEENSTVIIDGKVLGNTQYFAQVIADYTGADLFRIEPETPYTTDHDALVQQAKDEQQAKARPAIKNPVEDMSQYDTVFIGYPNWWGDMPMILYSFFDTYDLSGKTVIPFDTHGGSGLSDTVDTIRGLEPNADVKEGKAISRNQIADAKDEIESWLSGMGFKKTAGRTEEAVSAETSGADSGQSASGVTLALNGQTYPVTLADNETARAFRAALPQTLSMTELNGNEKYIYLDQTFPEDASSPGTIEAGDLMLYQDNCIVLFYKTFTTAYTYTKIGHVEGFDSAAASMDAGTITAGFS